MKIYTTRLTLESIYIDTSTIGDEDLEPRKTLSIEKRNVDRAMAHQAIDAFFDEFVKMGAGV